MRIIAILICLFSVVPVLGDEKNAIKITNLEKLNTDADEDDPFPGADGNLYYAAKKAERWEIMVSKKNASGIFGPGKIFLSSKEADFRSPFFFQGSLYFAHNKVPDEKLKDLKNYDIVKKNGDSAPLPLLGISEKEDELHPWIAAQGKEFYFSRKLSDDWTLFVAVGPYSGPIGKAKQVGFPAGYYHASLTPNALTMYLQGPLEDGKIGLFRSKRKKRGADWSLPEPLNALNHAKSKFGDMSPALSSDGARLYFASDRPGGKGGLDLWWVLTKDLK